MKSNQHAIAFHPLPALAVSEFGLKEALDFNRLTRELLPKNRIWKRIGNIAADVRRKALPA